MIEALFFIAGFVMAIAIMAILASMIFKSFSVRKNEDFSTLLAAMLDEIEEEKDTPGFFVYTPDNMAYWLQDDAIYCAEIVSGEVNIDEGKPVDLNNLSGEELEDILLIMDTLRKENKK